MDSLNTRFDFLSVDYLPWK